MTTVISVENLSKSYKLGQIGTGTFTHDLNVWWARVRGKPNPMLRIGEADHGNREGEEIWALKDVSFDVQQGEVLGIIGRNGAGKSTLLKILSRVTAPTSGKVKIKGRIASLLEVGTGFHPDLTGRENVYLNGAILGMTREEVRRKFDEIVDFAEIEKFIDTPVKRYSSGMYVRLAFAVAAHLDPEILVVDEVLAVGDVEFQKKCLGKMGDVAKEGRTVLFVSHNLAAVSSLCPGCLCLNNGQINNFGSTDLVIRNYLSHFALSKFNDVHFNRNTHRIGNGLVKFDSIVLKSRLGEKQRQFNIGDDIVIEFWFNATSILVGKTIKVAVELKTSDGFNISNMIDVDSNFKFDHLSAYEKVSVCLTDVRFYPGMYYISLWCGSLSGETYDYVENCINFEIIGGGNLTMRTLPRNAGLLFLTPEWSRSHE